MSVSAAVGGALIGGSLGGLLDKPMTTAQFEEAQSYGFGELIAELSLLRPAVNAAVELDRSEALSLWKELAKGVVLGIWYVPGFKSFVDKTDALVADAYALLGAVESLCDVQLRKHASVPDDLGADADLWLSNSASVSSKAGDCAGQTNVAGWSGEDKIAYDTMVTVQVNAMTELAGVMRSTSQACATAALLNRAIFMVVAEAITAAVAKISTAEGRGIERFGRTATALSELEYLEKKVGKAISGAVAEGSANGLAQEINNTITMPKVLTPGGWPSGGAAAGVDPADTADGVTSDGSDAKGSVYAGSKKDHDGVNRL